MISSELKYIIPSSLSEAHEVALQMENDFKFLAGGTDVMVNRNQGNENSPCLIDISELPELKGVVVDGEYLRIGALEILHDLKNHTLIREEFPLLIEAAMSVGSPLIRKTATIGGNVLCENRCLFYNQSEWWRSAIGYCLKCEGDICIATGGRNACFSEMVSDTAPALIAMDAMIELSDNKGTVIKKLEEIYTGDGVKPRNIPEATIITAILLPLHRKFKTSFSKLRERESLEFTSLTVAIAVDKNQKIKIAMSGVDPKPVVVEGSLSDNYGEMIAKAVKGSRAVDNDMYTRTYRREMIKVFLERGFIKLGITKI